MKGLVSGLVLLGMCGGVGWGQEAGVSPMLQPALVGIKQTMTGLQPQRWKLPGQMKEQTATDIGSIQRDLDTTLPGLTAAADAAPESAAAALPVASNLDALYDVLLRVTERAQIAAPDDQMTAAAKALQGLEDARRALNARVATLATNTERQVHDLQQNVAAQTAAASAAKAQLASLQAAKPTPCPAAKTVRKRTVKKPAVKPAATPAPAAKPSGV